MTDSTLGVADFEQTYGAAVTPLPFKSISGARLSTEGDWMAIEDARLQALLLASGAGELTPEVAVVIRDSRPLERLRAMLSEEDTRSVSISCLRWLSNRASIRILVDYCLASNDDRTATELGRATDSVLLDEELSPRFQEASADTAQLIGLITMAAGGNCPSCRDYVRRLCESDDKEVATAAILGLGDYRQLDDEDFAFLLRLFSGDQSVQVDDRYWRSSRECAMWSLTQYIVFEHSEERMRCALDLVLDALCDKEFADEYNQGRLISFVQLLSHRRRDLPADKIRRLDQRTRVSLAMACGQSGAWSLAPALLDEIRSRTTPRDELLKVLRRIATNAFEPAPQEVVDMIGDLVEEGLLTPAELLSIAARIPMPQVRDYAAQRQTRGEVTQDVVTALIGNHLSIGEGRLDTIAELVPPVRFAWWPDGPSARDLLARMGPKASDAVWAVIHGESSAELIMSELAEADALSPEEWASIFRQPFRPGQVVPLTRIYANTAMGPSALEGLRRLLNSAGDQPSMRLCQLIAVSRDQGLVRTLADMCRTSPIRRIIAMHLGETLGEECRAIARTELMAVVDSSNLSQEHRLTAMQSLRWVVRGIDSDIGLERARAWCKEEDFALRDAARSLIPKIDSSLAGLRVLLSSVDADAEDPAERASVLRSLLLFDDLNLHNRLIAMRISDFYAQRTRSLVRKFEELAVEGSEDGIVEWAADVDRLLVAVYSAASQRTNDEFIRSLLPPHYRSIAFR